MATPAESMTRARRRSAARRAETGPSAPQASRRMIAATRVTRSGSPRSVLRTRSISSRLILRSSASRARTEPSRAPRSASSAADSDNRRCRATAADRAHLLDGEVVELVRRDAPFERVDHAEERAAGERGARLSRRSLPLRGRGVRVGERERERRVHDEGQGVQREDGFAHGRPPGPAPDYRSRSSGAAECNGRALLDRVVAITSPTGHSFGRSSTIPAAEGPPQRSVDASGRHAAPL